MRRPSWRRWLAGAAALTGALAPFAGSPYRRPTPGPADGATPGSGDAMTLARAGEDQRAVPGSVHRSSEASPLARTGDGPGVTRGSAQSPVAGSSEASLPARMGEGPGARLGQAQGPVHGSGEVSPLARTGEGPGVTLGSVQVPVLGSIDVAQLVQVVADQQDHIPAVELATWLRAHRVGLRVIDLRSASEFTAFHVPGAEHVALEDLAQARFGPDETVVLYSETGVHGAQAWVFLRALGHHQVFFLRNGLHEWLDDVMSPTLAADAPAEARAAFDRVVELSRCFGGTPRRLTTAATATGAAPVAIRRRGC